MLLYNDIIILIKITKVPNNVGDIVETEVKREVFAEVKSVGQSEFYQAHSNGFKPEIKFVIADYYDYDGEEELIYNEKRYNIIRTYRNGVQLEITCGGNNYANAENVQV